MLLVAQLAISTLVRGLLREKWPVAALINFGLDRMAGVPFGLKVVALVCLYAFCSAVKFCG